METILATFFILQIGFRRIFFSFQRILISLGFKVISLVLKNFIIFFA